MFRGLSAVALILAMAACSVNDFETADYERIVSKEDFLSRVVGKELVLIESGDEAGAGSVFIVNADGTISGAFWPSPASGTWEWRSGKYCSEVVVGDMRLPYACKEAWISGNYFRLPTRPDPTKFSYYEIR